MLVPCGLLIDDGENTAENMVDVLEKFHHVCHHVSTIFFDVGTVDYKVLSCGGCGGLPYKK
jgi:hypothetical protein